MTAPESFTRELERAFGGELRIRWSSRHGQWHLEQKIGRVMILTPPDGDREDDDYIRARDGYRLLQIITRGTSMPCPDCGAEITGIPIMHTAEVRCEACRRRGWDGRWAVGFWPLGDALISHRQKYAPERDGALRAVREAQLANQRKQFLQDRQLSNLIEAAGKDALCRFPQVGYSGKEFRG